MSEKDLQGKVALVVGGATGIGRASAELLAQKGASVVIGDVNLAGAEAAVAAIRAQGGSAEAVRVDISVEEDVRALVAATIDRFGALHVLHNNAALTSHDIIMRDGAITALETEIWDRVLAVNLRGPMVTCKHAVPHMLKAGGGAIVNTSSALALQGDQMPVAYAASKAGLIALTRSLAVQYGKQRIRANAVAVGMVLSEALTANFPPPLRAVMEAHHLTPYLGEPQHIANVVAFLASEAAAYITGQVIVADGGVTCHVPQLADFRKMQAG